MKDPYYNMSPPRGHGSFPSHFHEFDQFSNDFANLQIGKGPSKLYEFYRFTKKEDWTEAHRIKISAPQDELATKAIKAKKNTSVLESLKKMSDKRRAQIDRLIDDKNFRQDDRAAPWSCVYIDSPGSKPKVVGGKRIVEHKQMDVIIAQDLFAGRGNDLERTRPFMGEKSAINEPLIINDKAKEKDKQPKGGKETKDGDRPRQDPFDAKDLFNTDGAPLDEKGPIPQYPPKQAPLPQVLDQGMGHQSDFLQGQPLGMPSGPPQAPPMGDLFGPSQGQPMGHFEPMGSHFAQPAPVQNLPPGIQIINDPMAAHNGPNEQLHFEDDFQPGPADMPPHHAPPQRRQPKGFAGPGPGHGHSHKKQSHPPEVIIDNPQQKPRGSNDTNKWVNDSSSRGSDEEVLEFWEDDDERSSHTSHSDDHHPHHHPHHPHHSPQENLVRRGSLIPHRRSSTKHRELTHREHRRVSSHPVVDSSSPPPPRRRRDSSHYRHDSDYYGERFDTIVAATARPRRPSSSRHRPRDAIRHPQPSRLQPVEHHPRSPPRTPVSGPREYSPLPRPELIYPDQLGRERDSEWERYREADRRLDDYQTRSPPRTPPLGATRDYYPLRRSAGPLYPYDLLRESERERGRERRAEYHMREKRIREDEDELRRRERRWADQDLFLGRDRERELERELDWRGRGRGRGGWII